MLAYLNVSLVILLSAILLYHSYKFRGKFNTLLIAIISGGIGVLAEYVGVTSGGYSYTSQNLVMVELFTFFGWIANTLMALHLAMVFLSVRYQEKLDYIHAFKLGFVTAFVGVVYDLFTDPVATALKVWVWSYEGPWFGVPIENFLGWFVILASNSIGYHLTVYYGKSKIQRIILAIISIITGSLCVIGTISLCIQLGIR